MAERTPIGDRLQLLSDATVLISDQSVLPTQATLVRHLRITPMEAHGVLSSLRERGIVGGSPLALLRHDTRQILALLRAEQASEMARQSS